MPIDAAPPAPVVAVAPAPTTDQTPFVTVWTPDAPSCTGGKMTVIRIETPTPTRPRVYDRPITLRFRLDGNGRPYHIAPVTDRDQAAESLGYVLKTYDFEPALAGSVFSKGSGKRQCQITYRPQTYSLANAPVPALIDWVATGSDARRGQNVTMRMLGSETTCNEKMEARETHYPDFSKYPGEQGHPGIIAITFDIDADGVPRNVSALRSTMGTEATLAAKESLGQSRFDGGPLTHCLLFAVQPPQDTLPPPSGPKAAELIEPGARCPVKASSVLQVSEVPFPPNFRRRNIEGWTIVRFDISPGGEVQNVVPILSEPASSFGEHGKRVIMAAAGQTSGSGYSGCVVRVYFKIDNSVEPGVYKGKPPKRNQ